MVNSKTIVAMALLLFLGAHPETHSFCKNCSDRANKRLSN